MASSTSSTTVPIKTLEFVTFISIVTELRLKELINGNYFHTLLIVN